MLKCLQNKRRYPHSPFQCWEMVKCRLLLDESVLSTLHRGGEGQNAYRMKFSNPCDQGCSIKSETRDSFSTRMVCLLIIRIFSRRTEQMSDECFPKSALDRSYV